MLGLNPELVIHTLFHTLWCFISRVAARMGTTNLIKVRITLQDETIEKSILGTHVIIFSLDVQYTVTTLFNITQEVL